MTLKPDLPETLESEDPVCLAEAFNQFQQAFPRYTTTTYLDELRTTDYTRLDEQNQIYLDYTGGGLHAKSQLQAHLQLLNHNVFGNPHSNNPTSSAMTQLVDQTRANVLAYFNADPNDYIAVFTPNASGALKHVGESYPFQPNSHYLLTFDNHNSVNGIREFAKQKGATVRYLPITQPELRIDPSQLSAHLNLADPVANNLFAFPAQSNFSGVQHPLEIIAQAHDYGWDVLLDGAAFAPTNRLDIDYWKPDFVSLSFYKIFGYPTGIGCLIARKDTVARLKRPWFAGGTISIASVQGNGHYLLDNEAGFEDGTIDYLNLPAIEIGLRHIAQIGIELIHERVMCLTGWLIEHLLALKHSNGQPLVHIHGPHNLKNRGGTITVSFYDSLGNPFDDRRIESLAGEANISIRTGCFCNPGAGEVAHGLNEGQMRHFFSSPTSMSFQELRVKMYSRYNKSVSAVRVSVGLATNFADIFAFGQFAQQFLNKTVSEVGGFQAGSENGRIMPDGS